ncbi:unnamed protein product [Microthlaspi erraticum]|uniref:F-box domain-containing protein n=1 Tax=Microthlaspi erraticum TaxID=1685480 RepID=A0A6D2HKR2_9BRAS|nr:unnamed protein product [Microthlaspi erraticum]
MLSSVADQEKPPCTKRLKLSPSPCGLSSLPTELVMSCLARVSKLDHPSLSLVSKWHRSQLFSPELYNFRSLLGSTENIIYLCILIPPEPNPRWFAFSPKTLNSPSRLVPIRSNDYQPREVSSVVAHGYGIYVMGGRRISGKPSPSVLFLDCRSHTWTILPAMRVARQSAAAGVVDGRYTFLEGARNRLSAAGERFSTQRRKLGIPCRCVWLKMD